MGIYITQLSHLGYLPNKDSTAIPLFSLSLSRRRFSATLHDIKHVPARGVYETIPRDDNAYPTYECHRCFLGNLSMANPLPSAPTASSPLLFTILLRVISTFDPLPRKRYVYLPRGVQNLVKNLVVLDLTIAISELNRFVTSPFSPSLSLIFLSTTVFGWKKRFLFFFFFKFLPRMGGRNSSRISNGVRDPEFFRYSVFLHCRELFPRSIRIEVP